jgi:hypothetical protein
MDYNAHSEVIRINKDLCSFSQDGKFLAMANQTNLLIKNTGSFDNYLILVFSDIIEVSIPIFLNVFIYSNKNINLKS